MAKRRGNIIDILILLVIAAAVLLAVYKFGVVNRNESTGVAEESEKTTYTALIDEVRLPTVNALHAGDLIFDEKTGTCIGEIKEVSHKPYMKNVTEGKDGIKSVEYPDYYSITLTIEGAVVEKEEGYFVDGVVEIKANSEMNTFTKYAMPVIKVTDIKM